MKNIAALSADLGKLYEEIRTGAIELKVAAELNNTAGKRLKVYQMQLAYHALRGEAPNIPFLAAESVMTKPLPPPTLDPKAGKPAKLSAA